MRFVLIVLASLLVSACGEGFSGTYSDAMGVQRYDFKDNGKVTLRISGVEKTVNFKRDGDTLRMTEKGNDNEVLIFTIKDDNTLIGFGGAVTLKKQK